VSSSVATDANDVGDSLDVSTSSSTSYTKQNRSDSSSAAGSDADSVLQRHRNANISDGYASTEQSWNPELDGAEALSAVAQFNQAISGRNNAAAENDSGSAYISGDDWQHTVAKQMHMHREMILNGRMTGTAQPEMGSDSEDEAYDENEDAFLMPQWAQKLQRQQEHELLHESAAHDAFDSDMSSVRSSNDSVQSLNGISRGISRRQQKEVYDSAMESIKMALKGTLKVMTNRHKQRGAKQEGVVLTRKSLVRISNLVLREMKKATQDAAAIAAASLSSSMGSGFLKQWAGPVSLSNMRSPLSLGGKDAHGIFVLDTHIKSTLRDLLMRYEGRELLAEDAGAKPPLSSNQPVLLSEIVQDVMDLLYEESTWTKLATGVEDSYRQDVELMHASWQERLKSYGRIGQLGARHAAWERDREKLTSRMGGLKQARDRDMKLLNAERRKRLEKSVQSNTEAGESGNEESGDNGGGFDPLNFQRAQNAYVADEFEGTSEASGRDGWSVTNNVSSATSMASSVMDDDFENTGYSAEEEESEVEMDDDGNSGSRSSCLAVGRGGAATKRRSKKGKMRKKKKSSAAAAAGVYGAPVARKGKRKQKQPNMTSAKTKRGRSASPADKKRASPTTSQKTGSGSKARLPNEISPRSLTRMSRGDNLERSPHAAAFAAGMEMAVRNASGKSLKQGGAVGARIGVNVPTVAGAPIFSEEETQRYARSYSDAIAAAGSAADISREIESSLQTGSDATGRHGAFDRKTTPTTVPQVVFSYDGKLRELFQRARRSGVDWSAMFAVTDADAAGVIRERDFRDAMSHIASADVRFEGLQPDEMAHVLRRFSRSKNEMSARDSPAAASLGMVNYKNFVKFYTDDSNHTDEGGFISIGELPMDADVFDDSVGLEAFADKLAREAEAMVGESDLRSGKKKKKLMTPVEYYAIGGGGDEGHDQTSRLNKQLATAMLRKMGAESPSRSPRRVIDPAVMTEEEINEAAMM
jgi:hypothetical protein